MIKTIAKNTLILICSITVVSYALFGFAVWAKEVRTSARVELTPENCYPTYQANKICVDECLFNN